MDIEKKDLGKAIVTVAEPEIYDKKLAYERLTYVKHNGHVYLSKQDVPVGTSPTGEVEDEYWLDFEISAASCRLGRAYYRITDWNPIRPTGGSYSNPHPVEDIWQPAPYNGNGILWYSERLFTEDGRNQDAEWSMPAQITYTLYSEFFTSNAEKPVGNPDTNPDGWFKGYLSDTIWLACREVYNGVKHNWLIVCIRGTLIEEIQAEVDNSVGTPEVIVTNKGTDLNPIYKFFFKNIKGQKGDKGDTGETGKINSISATIDDNIGTPEIEVSISGDPTNADISFDFRNLKGEKGDTGDKGEKGDRGNYTFIFEGEINPAGNNQTSSVVVPAGISLTPGDNVIDIKGNIYTVRVLGPTTFAVIQDAVQNISGSDAKRGVVYRRTNETITEAPVGGSYDNPIPDTTGWSEVIPDGAAKLWVSTRLFTSDGKNQEEVWSTPKTLTYVQYYEINYSIVEEEPGTPDTNPDNWTKTATDFVWIAVRQIYNGTKQEWNVSKVIGQKGDKGDAGKNFTILGYKDTLEQLQEEVPNPNQGDAYGIGTEEAYDIYVYDTEKGWLNNGSIGSGSSKVNTDKVFVVDTIPVAGGPLSDLLNKAGITEISKDDDLQTVLMNLFTKEIYPTNLVFTEGTIKSTVPAPNMTINKSGLIEVGTVITVSAITIAAGNKTTTDRKYSGFTYGYSLTNDNVRDSANTSVNVPATDIQNGAESYKLSRTINGSVVSATDNTNPAEVTIESTTFEAIEGLNTVKADVTGITHSCKFAAMPVYYACSNLGKTNENNKSAAKDENTITSAVPTNTTNRTVTAVYPYFTNADNNEVIAKEPLTTNHYMNAIEFVDEGPNKHTFKIPAKFTVTKIEILNTLSGKYEDYDLSNFTITEESIQVQGKNVAYKVYTRNDSGFNGATSFNITF